MSCGSVTFTLTVNAVGHPLEIVGITINYGDPQRSNIARITIQFNQAVDLQELIDDNTIVDMIQLFETSTQVVLTTDRFQYDPATFVLVLDLTEDGFGGSDVTMLADGRYELRFNTSGIQTPDGRTLEDGDGTNDGVWRYYFHRLEGDFDGDAQVTSADGTLFLGHYRSYVGRYGSAYDLNSDGRIDIVDYLLWRRLYGHTV